MTDKDRSLHHLLNSTTKTVFTTKDFDKVWKYDRYASLIQRLNYLKKTGKIKMLRKGTYSIVGREIDEFELANKLRTPSYISFETVLFREGVIFQWDDKITVAGNESITLKVLELTILFRQLKDSILLNKTGIRKEKNFYIASKERALLDMLYINPRFAFDNLRPIDFSKLDELIGIYQRKTLLELTEKLKTHA